MEIPIGKDYSLNLLVQQDGSFIPKNLGSLASAVFTILDIDSGEQVANTGEYHIIGNNSDGRLALILPTSATETLVASYGGKEDRYYNKPTYKGSVVLKFQNPTTDPDMITIIKEISAIDV